MVFVHMTQHCQKCNREFKSGKGIINFKGIFLCTNCRSKTQSQRDLMSINQQIYLIGLENGK